MSNSAYLLVKFDDKQKLPLAIDKLQDETLFENYDAIDGHYHLLIKTKDQNEKTFAFVRSFEGFSDMSVCQIEVDNQKEFVLDETNRYCYLFIEADEKERKTIQKKIDGFSESLFASPTKGNYNLIALLKNDTFDKIDRFVKKEINNLDGILRYKQDHVIFLDRI